MKEDPVKTDRDRILEITRSAVSWKEWEPITTDFS